MESYSEWRVTVYDVIFGELRFLESDTVQLSKLYRKLDLGELAFQIVKWLKLGELAVNNTLKFLQSLNFGALAVI